ncbi:KNR4/SMI1 homolog [Nicotiana tomentosiformis]|uniref:KNR4/SMI1 homolog n=1 Tax=Nicotiana tomentosiformis TaxID=4098 RepID=UPI00388C77CC
MFLSVNAVWLAVQRLSFTLYRGTGGIASRWKPLPSFRGFCYEASKVQNPLLLSQKVKEPPAVAQWQICRDDIKFRVGKDAVLRPSSVEEEASASVPKPVNENKRKRAPILEDKKPKKRTARKPNKNIIPLAIESVLRLRDEEEEKEEEEKEEEDSDGSALAARMMKTTDVPQVAGSMVVHKAPPRTEDISEKDSGRVSELLDIEDASHRSQQMGDMSKGTLLESFRTEENAPGDSLWVVAIEDSSTFSAFSEGAIREAQALGALELDRPHDGEDPFRDLFIGVEDTTGTSDASDLFHGVQQALNQHKIEMIGKLREEVDVIKAESLKWKEGMNHFAIEKETARAQLSSAENQLQKMKEKGSVQARRIEELDARLAFELAKAESDAEKAKAGADALVAVYRADAEVAQVQARKAAETTDTRAHWVAELAKCRSRRGTLEEIHARGFDLAEKIKRAKELKADDKALVSDDDDNDDDYDDDGSKSGSENAGRGEGEEPDKEDTAYGDNQEA